MMNLYWITVMLFIVEMLVIMVISKKDKKKDSLEELTESYINWTNEMLKKMV